MQSCEILCLLMTICWEHSPTASIGTWVLLSRPTRGIPSTGMSKKTRKNGTLETIIESFHFSLFPVLLFVSLQIYGTLFLTVSHHLASGIAIRSRDHIKIPPTNWKYNIYRMLMPYLLKFTFQWKERFFVAFGKCVILEYYTVFVSGGCTSLHSTEFCSTPHYETVQTNFHFFRRYYIFT